MQSSMGKNVIRYDMCNIARRAYVRAMTPVNIMSCFRNTCIFPFSKDALEEDIISLQSCQRRFSSTKSYSNEIRRGRSSTVFINKICKTTVCLLHM